MQLILNDKIRKALLPVIGPDWPLSLGYTVYLVSDHRLGRKETRLKPKLMKQLRNGEAFEGAHCVWDKFRTVVIIISPEKKASKVRICELVAHEVSHAVDGFLARSATEMCDTELRAYMIDWMVGKILHNFKL